MTTNEISQTAEQKFGDKVSNFLQPHNAKGTALLSFAAIKIRQCRLHDITPEDALHEAILQGLRHTRKTEEEIRCPEAWLRVAMMGNLKNRVRQTIRQEQLTEVLKCISQITSNDPALKVEKDDLSAQLDQARQTLSDEDQEILTLYLNQQKTYEQIQAYYERKDGELINLPTIRKRVSRARERAVKAFHEMNSSPSRTGRSLGQNSENLSTSRIQ
jgi:RNA polymerase sigma factor (sigma-70 family)